MLLPLEAGGALGGSGVLPAGSAPPPVILMVGRRHVRKNKLVDFAGEYHLDLLVGQGALPLIYPRVRGMADWVRVVLPFVDGLLLVEGEDISPDFFVGERVPPELGEQVRDQGHQIQADPRTDLWAGCRSVQWGGLSAFGWSLSLRSTRAFRTGGGPDRRTPSARKDGEAAP